MTSDASVSNPSSPLAPEPAAVHRRALFLLVATALLWSLGGVLIKWVDWNPVAIAGTRSLIGAALIGVAFRH